MPYAISTGIDTTSRQHETPLKIAVKEADAEAADHGPDPPREWLDTVRMLIEHDADLKKSAGNEPNLLFLCQSDPGVFELLVQHGLDPLQTDEAGRTLFHYLAHAGGSSEVVSHLIQHGVDINKPDKDGSTPLHSVQYADTLRLLVSRGATINAVNHKSETPLHMCLREPLHGKWSEFLPLLEAFVSCGADLQARNGDGKTPAQMVADIKNLREKPRIVALLTK